MTGQLPRWADTNSAERFDRRFAEPNVNFWLPRLVEAARIEAGQRVVDLGCGTGGFAAAIAESTGAQVIGIDLAERFLQYAAAERRGARWVLGDAARIPVRSGSVDAVLMSLLLHRVPDPAAVIADAARIVRPGGTVVIRTVAPEDAAVEVPYRFFPAMAAAQRSRMPATEALSAWLEQAGLPAPEIQRIVRERRPRPDELERGIRSAVPVRYPDMDSEQLETGLARLRAELAAQPVQLRGTTLLVSVRPDRAW